MSDTQGAPDTATGGLENDMPGLGNAPASPRMVPSGLGGIANFARQALGIGAPAPRAPGPGRSPWDAPGQSQIPQGPRTPPQPNAPRWQGTTASMYLPRHSPQPPANFTPFVGTIPRGDFRRWGQPEQYGNLPEAFELPGIAQGLSRFFGQNGGGFSAPTALLMGKYAGDYINGVMKGEEFKAKMAKEKWLEHSIALQEQQEQQHIVYADRMREYFEAAGEDKHKAETLKIKGVGLRDALYQDAAKLGDTDITNMLESGASFDAIMRFQDYRDSRLKDLQKVNAKAQEQEAEDNKAREDAGLPPRTSESGGRQGDPFAPSQPQTAAGGAQPPMSSGAPAPTLAPSGVAGPSGQPAQPDQTGVLKPYQEDGNNVFRGEQNINSLPKAIRPDVANWAAQQGAKIDKIRNDFNARKIADNQLPAELDKVIPGMGEDYTNTLNGAPLPTGPLGRSPYWQSIKNMIPGFNPVVQANTLRDYATSGRSGQRLTAGTRMGEAAVIVLEELKKIPEGETVPQYVIDQWISSGVTGDPKWSNLFTALNTYMQEAQSLQSNTGRFFETEMQEQRRNVRLTEGPRAIRGILKIDAQNSVNLIEQLKDNYHRGSRRQDDPPTYDPQRLEILKSLTSLDEANGFRDIPKDRLPEPLQKVWPGTGGGGPGGGSTIPKGWTVTPIQ